MVTLRPSGAATRSSTSSSSPVSARSIAAATAVIWPATSLAARSTAIPDT